MKASLATASAVSHERRETVKKQDGGPAFPLPARDLGSATGMSLRDYAAIKAMQGLLASGIGRDGNYQPAITARYAYQHADAMLTERAPE